MVWLPEATPLETGMSNQGVAEDVQSMQYLAFARLASVIPSQETVGEVLLVQLSGDTLTLVGDVGAV